MRFSQPYPDTRGDQISLPFDGLDAAARIGGPTGMPYHPSAPLSAATDTLMRLPPNGTTGLKRPLWIGLVCILATLATTSGCGAIKKDKMAVSLQAATHGYQSALRWGYYESAYAFVDPEQREDKPMPPNLTGLHLSGYDVVQPPSIKDDDTATQIVQIEYLYENRQVVKSLTDRQLWRWDADKKTWWLTSGLPKFKER